MLFFPRYSQMHRTLLCVHESERWHVRDHVKTRENGTRALLRGPKSLTCLNLITIFNMHFTALKGIHNFIQQRPSLLFFWTFYLSKNPEKSSHKNIKQQKFSTLIKKIRAPNQHIRMISEGSCDTEDWINDAENSILHHRYKLYINIY